jgi:hypothetical protein
MTGSRLSKLWVSLSIFIGMTLGIVSLALQARIPH